MDKQMNSQMDMFRLTPYIYWKPNNLTIPEFLTESKDTLGIQNVTQNKTEPEKKNNLNFILLFINLTIVFFFYNNHPCFFRNTLFHLQLHFWKLKDDMTCMVDTPSFNRHRQTDIKTTNLSRDKRINKNQKKILTTMTAFTKFCLTTVTMIIIAIVYAHCTLWSKQEKVQI